MGKEKIVGRKEKISGRKEKISGRKLKLSRAWAGAAAGRHKKSAQPAGGCADKRKGYVIIERICCNRLAVLTDWLFYSHSIMCRNIIVVLIQFMFTAIGWLIGHDWNVFVKPNEQSSSLLEYSAMARIFVQASAIEFT